MKKASLSVCSVAMPFMIVGCGSDGAASADSTAAVQTWRLKYSQVTPYSTTSIAENPYAGDYSIHYDEANEITSAVSYYQQPTYKAVTVLDGQVMAEEAITKEQIPDYQNRPNISIVASGYEEACFNEGDIAGLTAIANAAADSWSISSIFTYYLSDSFLDIRGDTTFDCPVSNDIDNQPCVFTSGVSTDIPEQPDSCSDPIIKTSTLGFDDWGDNTYIWGSVSESWAGDTESSDGLKDDYFFESDPEGMVSEGFIFPLLGDINALPTTEQAEPWLPVENTPLREYSNQGLLTYIGYKDLFDSNQYAKEVVLSWQGQALDKITVIRPEFKRIDNPSNGVVQDIYYGNPHVEYRYDYSQFQYGVVKASIYIDVEGELQKLIDLTATYEQADCGPMTLERSKKYVPEPFPICFER